MAKLEPHHWNAALELYTELQLSQKDKQESLRVLLTALAMAIEDVAVPLLPEAAILAFVPIDIQTAMHFVRNQRLREKARG